MNQRFREPHSGLSWKASLGTPGPAPAQTGKPRAVVQAHVQASEDLQEETPQPV